ncbi:signal peptidase I [bacterium]|nr:signal peptidase I [bacterium]
MNNENTQKNEKSKFKKYLNLTGKILTYLFIILMVYVVLCIAVGFVKRTPPKIFNHYVFVVLSPSMEPEIKEGDIVFVKSTTIDKAELGDVICFICIDQELSVYGQTIVHEAILIEDVDGNLEITTKGTNNDLKDNKKVTKNNFVGIVTGKSRVFGKIYSSLMSAYAIIYVFGLIIILKISQDAIKKIKEVKKEKEENDLKEKIKQEYIESIQKEQQKSNEEK